MSEPLKYKAETAVASYLGTVAAQNGHVIFKGQNPGEQTPPCIVVSVGSVAEAFADALPKRIQIGIEIISPIDTDQNQDGIAGATNDRALNWSAHRSTVQAIEAAMQDVVALQTHANKGNLSTSRPVTGFYVYDVEEESQQSNYAGAERMLISALGYVLTAEAQDN